MQSLMNYSIDATEQKTMHMFSVELLNVIILCDECIKINHNWNREGERSEQKKMLNKFDFRCINLLPIQFRLFRKPAMVSDFTIVRIYWFSFSATEVQTLHQSETEVHIQFCSHNGKIKLKDCWITREFK